DFLVEVFKISEPSDAHANAVTARQLLDRGAQRIEEQLASEPAVRARLLRVMGRAYGELGLYEPETRVLEQELQAQVAQHGKDSLEAADTLAALAWAHS